MIPGVDEVFAYVPSAAFGRGRGLVPGYMPPGFAHPLPREEGGGVRWALQGAVRLRRGHPRSLDRWGAESGAGMTLVANAGTDPGPA